MILVLNCGSSSIKYELFRVDGQSVKSAAGGAVERIGGPGARVRHWGPGGEVDREADVAGHAAGLEIAAELVAGNGAAGPGEIGCVAHRVVHGGRMTQPAVLIDAAVVREIEACVPLAPLHNPANLAGIEAAAGLFPGASQVAVFDTAFHQTMPTAAYLYALPYEYCEKYGIRRYGFHGVSHRYVSQRAGEILGRDPAGLRLVTCHLGAGSSLAAVAGGRSVDTSMGFTPLEGLMMATRCGDLDPAVVLFLAERAGMSTREIDAALNRSSGLLGVSGLSADVRDLIRAAASGHERSALALEMFCYRVRKYIGAYAAAMGGLDGLVFTAGIGENRPEIRWSVCESLAFLGVRLDPEKNRSTVGGAEGSIGAAGAPVDVLVIPTEEEKVMAVEARRLVYGKAG